MLSPDGLLMCYISKKRAKWYMDRNLAKNISDKKIQLLFKPNGLGHNHEPHRNIPVKNCCVVCGFNSDISQLSKHHTTPECFQKYFPLKWKTYRSHNILFLCLDCHNKYEIEAQKLKQKMIEPFGGEEIFKNDVAIRKRIKTLLKDPSYLPPDKKLDLQIEVMIYHDVDDVSEEVLESLLKKKVESPFKSYAENITDFVEFNKLWKQHFISVMNPKFLPPYWGPDYEPLSDNPQEFQRSPNR